MTTAINLADYHTAQTAAARLARTPRAVQSLCARGHFPGAIPPADSITGRWLIPRSAVESRRKKAAKNQLPAGGRPPKSNGRNELKKTEKNSR